MLSPIVRKAPRWHRRPDCFITCIEINTTNFFCRCYQTINCPNPKISKLRGTLSPICTTLSCYREETKVQEGNVTFPRPHHLGQNLSRNAGSGAWSGLFSVYRPTLCLWVQHVPATPHPQVKKEHLEAVTMVFPWVIATPQLSPGQCFPHRVISLMSRELKIQTP